MIINTENTCYLGCVLQCLIHTKSLGRYLTATPHHEDVFAKHFVELCKSVWAQQKTDPTQFYNLLKSKYKYFHNNDHHDAHEAYGVILDYLTQAFPRIQQTMFKHSSRTARRAWSSRKDHTIIDEIFKLMYQVDCVCDTCAHHITTYETDYVHYIYSEDTEKLTDYACDKCGKFGTTRTQRLIHFPQTLVVMYKTPTIPSTVLGVGKNYNLFAWVNHVKFNESTGHYRAVIKNRENKTWNLVDDDKTIELSHTEIPAYMSFYELIVF